MGVISSATERWRLHEVAAAGVHGTFVWETNIGRPWMRPRQQRRPGCRRPDPAAAI